MMNITICLLLQLQLLIMAGLIYHNSLAVYYSTTKYQTFFLMFEVTILLQ